ncbi:hypothetical protein MBLNU13_g09172t1 [Cladosporium sp. NU13]
MSSNREATLCALPVELFEQVISHLDDKVLPKLRLTCKGLHAAVHDSFCDLYVAHLGCWMLSASRWERIHNLVTANSSLARRIQTVTFTVDGLELRSHKDRPNYRISIPHWMNQSHGEKPGSTGRYDMSQEEAGLQQQGVADFALMVLVLQRLKAQGCLLRLNLSPGNPLENVRFPINPRTSAVHSDLQRAIAHTRAPIETISIDRLRHRDLEDALQGCKDELLESFASIRDIAMTPVKRDGFNTRKSRRRRWDVIRAMFARAQRLRRIHLHTTVEYRVRGDRTRAQQWTADLLLANRLDELKSLTLIGVSVRMIDLIEVLRRSSHSLEHLELDEVALGGGSEQAWPRVFDQLAASESLCTLKLVLPDLLHRDIFWTEVVNISGASRVETGGYSSDLYPEGVHGQGLPNMRQPINPSSSLRGGEASNMTSKQHDTTSPFDAFARDWFSELKRTLHHPTSTLLEYRSHDTFDDLVLWR